MREGLTGDGHGLGLGEALLSFISGGMSTELNLFIVFPNKECLGLWGAK